MFGHILVNSGWHSGEVRTALQARSLLSIVCVCWICEAPVISAYCKVAMGGGASCFLHLVPLKREQYLPSYRVLVSGLFISSI